MRRPIIAGNWKMNLNHIEAAKLAEDICENLLNLQKQDIDILLCPSFTSLQSVSDVIRKYRSVALGCQNISWEKSGAFTGEISTDMIKPFNVEYVIIGHSERRHILGEPDEILSKKMKRTIEDGFIPILCVGETLEQRENGEAKHIIEDQLRIDLAEIKNKLDNIVIAYEPVWAIGTGKNATASDAEDISKFIRTVLNDLQNGVANKVRIQYGGSVTPENIKSFMEISDIDGVLVGGASMKTDQFIKIINYKNNMEAALLS